MNVKAKIKDTSIADEIVIPLTMQPNASFPASASWLLHRPPRHSPHQQLHTHVT
jgi:hypothetical protein